MTLQFYWQACCFGHGLSASAPFTKTKGCGLSGEPIILEKRKQVQTEALIVCYQGNWFVINLHLILACMVLLTAQCSPRLLLLVPVLFFHATSIISV